MSRGQVYNNFMYILLLFLINRLDTPLSVLFLVSIWKKNIEQSIGYRILKWWASCRTSPLFLTARCLCTFKRDLPRTDHAWVVFFFVLHLNPSFQLLARHPVCNGNISSHNEIHAILPRTPQSADQIKSARTKKPRPIHQLLRSKPSSSPSSPNAPHNPTQTLSWAANTPTKRRGPMDIKKHNPCTLIITRSPKMRTTP